MVWVHFALIQVVSLLATILGWLVLIPACLAQAWVKDAKSIKDGRDIDRWKWKCLTPVFGNPEDGVSGQTALIGNPPTPYMLDAWPPWRAYCWSAFRNSCDNLKYVFAYKNGPLVKTTIFGQPVKLGWQEENGFKVPVFSIR